jgi:hypothetical protein
MRIIGFAVTLKILVLRKFNMIKGKWTVVGEDIK